MKFNQLRPIDFLDLASMYLFWGGSYVAVKVFVGSIPPLVGVTLRYAIAATVVGAIVGMRYSRRPPSRAEIRGAALTGLLFLGVGTGLMTLAAPHIDASLVALIFATVPAWLVLFEYVSTRHLAWNVLASGVLGLVGVAVLFANELVDPNGANSIGGMVLALVATLVWAGTTFRFNSIARPQATPWSLFFQSGTACLFLLIATTLSGEWTTFDPETVDRSAWFALLFASILGSVVAYSSFQRLLKRLPAEVASTYTFVNPVVATLAAVLVLGESLSAARLAAATIIVGAACLLAFLGTGDRTIRAAGGQSR